MGTRSLLVNFVGYPNEAFNLVPDNGLASLAACLLQAGHQTTIWDCATLSTMRKLYPYHESGELRQLPQRILAKVRARERPDQADLAAFYELEDRIDRYQDERTRELGRRMGERVERERLDFVGFKLWSGAGFHGSILLAEEIRKRSPSVRIFGGGPHVDMFMQRSFDVTDVFDVMAYGEGEEVIVQLAEYAAGNRAVAEVSNAIYRDGDGCVTTSQTRVRDVDAIPLPCYDSNVYPAMDGDDKIKIVLLDESRGCPNSCNFCIHPIKSGRRRVATAEALVGKLEQLIRRHGFHCFRFAGSNAPARLRKEIAAEILRRGLGVSFSGFAHVRGADEEDFGLLRKAGCVALGFGVESGSQRILDEVMNKRVRVDEIRQALKLCKEAGIATLASVIVPAPNDTETSQNETFELLCDVGPEATYVSFPVMALGTAWERQKERFGFELTDAEALYRRGMTHRMQPLAPAILWRPLNAYKLNGKTFAQMAEETAGFVERLERAGLATQLLDHVFLMADAVGAPPVRLGKLMSRLITSGEIDEIQDVAARINRGVLTARQLAKSR